MNTIDILIIVIILFSIYVGFKRGFVQSLLSMIATLVTYISARILSKPITYKIYETLEIRSKLQDRILPTVNEQVYTAGLNAQHGLLNKEKALELVEPIKEILTNIDFFIIDKIASDNLIQNIITKTGVAEKISQASGVGDTELVNKITESLVNYFENIILFVISAVVFVILFLVLRIIIGGVIQSFSNIVNRIPLFGTTNRILGIITGLVKGFINSVIVVLLIFITTKFTEIEPYITVENLERSKSYSTVVKTSNIIETNLKEIKIDN